MSYCRITIYELLQNNGNIPYNDVFFVEADPLFHNNGHFDYNLKSNYSVISKFKLKCPMGSSNIVLVSFVFSEGGGLIWMF